MGHVVAVRVVRVRVRRAVGQPGLHQPVLHVLVGREVAELAGLVRVECSTNGALPLVGDVVVRREVATLDTIRPERYVVLLHEEVLPHPFHDPGVDSRVRGDERRVLRAAADTPVGLGRTFRIAGTDKIRTTRKVEPELPVAVGAAAAGSAGRTSPPRPRCPGRDFVSLSDVRHPARPRTVGTIPAAAVRRGRPVPGRTARTSGPPAHLTEANNSRPSMTYHRAVLTSPLRIRWRRDDRFGQGVRHD